MAYVVRQYHLPRGYSRGQNIIKTALDAFGTTLLGHEPTEIGHVAAAAARGLGTLDFASLNPVEKILT